MIKLLTAIMCLGIYMVFFNYIRYLFSDITAISNAYFFKWQDSKFQKHIHRIFLVISKDKKEKRNEKLYYISTVAIAVGSIFFLKGTFYEHRLLVIALIIIFTTLPYAYISMKLVLKQRTGSFEGEALLREMFTQYKLNNKNIVTTIDATVAGLTDKEPVTKRALFRLSLRLINIASDSEMNDALNDFVYAVNTSWAKQLANNIFSAYREKMDIYTGLEVLLDNCKKINRNLEKNKQGNLESANMIKFIGPAAFAIFAILAIKMVDVSVVLNLMFRTPAGVILSAIILLSFIANVIIINLLTKQKYDI